MMGCCLHTVGSGPQVDGVQIIFQNDILSLIFSSTFDGEELLLEFTGEFFKPCGLLCPVGEHIVLEQLLCNRTGTLGKSSRGNSFYTCTENTADIKPLCS